VKRDVILTGGFVRGAKRLAKKDSSVTNKIGDTVVRLGEDIYQPSLRTHPLKGNLSGRYACSAGFDLRIIFRVVEEEGSEKVLLLSIGSHEDVY
jgi:mRNA interferase YafQ